MFVYWYRDGRRRTPAAPTQTTIHRRKKKKKEINKFKKMLICLMYFSCALTRWNEYENAGYETIRSSEFHCLSFSFWINTSEPPTLSPPICIKTSSAASLLLFVSVFLFFFWFVCFQTNSVQFLPSHLPFRKRVWNFSWRQIIPTKRFLYHEIAWMQQYIIQYQLKVQ